MTGPTIVRDWSDLWTCRAGSRGKAEHRREPSAEHAEVDVTALRYAGPTLGAGARLAALSPVRELVREGCSWQPKK